MPSARSRSRCWCGVPFASRARAHPPGPGAATPPPEPASDRAERARPAAEPARRPAGKPASRRGGAVVRWRWRSPSRARIWSARNVEVLRPIARGQLAPDFSLARIDGTPGAIAIGALRGQVVVLDFWATWCAPCVQMIPMLDDVHQTWAGRGVSFVGVNSDGGGATLDDIKAFMVEHPFSLSGRARRRRRGRRALPAGGAASASSWWGATDGFAAATSATPCKATLEKAVREAVEARRDRRALARARLLATSGLFREVGAAVAGAGQVAVPARRRAEHQLHAPRVAGADRALDHPRRRPQSACGTWSRQRRARRHRRST